MTRQLHRLTRACVATAAFMVLCVGVTAQDAAVDVSTPLTLERAIRIGLGNQNSVAIARSQVASSRARVTQARASYYPQVTPTFDYDYSYTRLRVGGATVRNDSDTRSAAIGMRQLLYDMGRREQNLAASRKGVTAAELNVADARQDVILSVTNGFYELKRQRALVRVAESSRDRTKTTLEATEAFAEAGTTRRIDVLQAQADLANAEVQLIQSRNNARLAETSLKNAMGIVTPAPILVDDTQPEAPPKVPDTKTVADYAKVALATRPDLQREEVLVSADAHSVRIAEIDAGLQVDASFTEAYRVDPNPGEMRGLTATFSYPLFDAGAARAAVRAAREGLVQGKEGLEVTRRTILTDVESAYLQREEARLRSAAADAALAAAKVNYEAARQAQAEGAAEILSVITAQTQLVTAETNAVEALYDYHTSVARLQRAIGVNDTFKVAEGSRR